MDVDVLVRGRKLIGSAYAPIPNTAAAHYPLARRTPQINARDIEELKL